MTSMHFFVILTAIWSIIPAMVVCVVLFMRLLSAERRVEALEMRKFDFDSINSLLSELRTEDSKMQAKILSVDESLMHLNNKWNARARVESAAEKRKEKDRKNGSAAGDDVDGDEPAFPYQQALPLPGMQQTGQKPGQRRAFGQFPS